MNHVIDDSPEAVTIRRLRRVMALFTGLLVASTWPLWTPGTAFPDIPWFAWAIYVPPESWDWVWLVALGGLLMLQFMPLPESRDWPAILQGVLFICALLLLPTDQHRLQPWVVQMVIGTLLIGLSSSNRQAVRCLRAFTISIYAWSAVSKLDGAFAQGHGPLLLEGLVTSVGLSTEMWSQTAKQLLAALFPLGELAVAILLMVPRSRRYGLWGAMAMHALLILTLGPRGLGHEWGVLIWNAFFIVQALILFRGREPMILPSDQRPPHDEETPPLPPVTLLAWCACLLPALSLVGLWDWWPSWAVYSSRPAVVRPFVAWSDVDKLPSSLGGYVGPPEPLSDLCPVNLDGWSYAERHCPLYPQERYRLAVINAALHEPGVLAKVVIQSTPNRWSGERVTETIPAEELEQRLTTFWWNTHRRGSTLD